MVLTTNDSRSCASIPRQGHPDYTNRYDSGLPAGFAQTRNPNSR